MIRNKPVIAILPTFNLENKENDPYFDRASFVRMYIKKIKESGGIPIGILEENVEDVLPLCDGFLWPGGSKIYKSFYKVIEHAIKYHKPLLGVCLGSQAIATYFNILEDMEEHKIKSIEEAYEVCKEEDPYIGLIEECYLLNHNHTVTKEKESINKARHKIKILKNSFLNEIYKVEELDVVSLHKYSIKRTSKNTLVSAKSSDGIIEAVEYHEDNQSILGVQFHPEIEEDKSLFVWLVNEARKKVEDARNSRSRNS